MSTFTSHGSVRTEKWLIVGKKEKEGDTDKK